MGCSTPGSTHYAGCACHEEHWQNEFARLTRERDEAREERDRARRDYEVACHLVAKMHHAATGAVTGPARGVVEDVADVRARSLVAEAKAERLESAMREIERKTGHFGEAPPPPEWMPMLALIAWVGRIARAALGGAS